MPESEQQRKIRRAISHWLTDQINAIPNAQAWQAGVRTNVLQALSEINLGFDDLGKSMQKRYRTAPDLALVDFYMKGGNAFKVSIGADLTSGGDSDWDTQVVINEWAPAPIGREVHALVEDIALDKLRQAGIAIANQLLQDNVNLEQVVQLAWIQARQNPIEGLNLVNYSLTYDNPQTIRRIFDQERLGLWFTEGTPLRDRANAAASEWVPGMVFNDAIGPFVIYRLGYGWHAELLANPAPGAETESIERPILMELIDITIPRRDTVEAVEVWDAIANQHIDVANAAVGFNNGVVVQLPFPDLYYHLREQLDMLCEIADNSSRHTDKMHKRFERLDRIYTSPNVNQAECARIISVQAGVPSIDALNTPGQAIAVTQRIYDLIPNKNDQQNPFQPAIVAGQYTVNPPAIAYRYGVLMMMQVTTAAQDQKDAFNGAQIKQEAEDAIKKARSSPVFTTLSKLGQWALSDDLVYFAQLQALECIDLPKVGLSGIEAAGICRVPAGTVENAVHTLTQGLGQNVTTEDQAYETDRGYGYSSDWTVVYFTNNKPTATVTLTTATEQQLAFDKSTPGLFGGQTLITAPLAEMARQRKMAASLVQDYIVRKALTRQYEAGQQAIEIA